MKARFNPAPVLLAALVAAAFPTYAAPAEPAQSAAVKPQASARKVVLTTGIKDGKMVFLGENGQPNPTLKANVGDTLEISISSGEGAQHDIVFPALNVASTKFDKSTGATKVRFKVTKAGSFEYYCTISGHRQIGMEGKLEVAGATAAAGASAKVAPAKAAVPLVEPARASAVSVAMNPNAVPAAIQRRIC